MSNRELFIGIGGTGVKTVGRLKAKLLEAFGGNKTKLGQEVQFLFVDTDQEDIRKVNEMFRPLTGAEDIISNQEHINLGHVNPFSEYHTAKRRREKGSAGDRERHLLEFVDPESVREFNDSRMERGASANRQQGRVGIWQGRNDIEAAIRSAADSLKGYAAEEAGFVKQFPCTIVSGTCGGTGSSSFLDVAYLLDRELRAKFGNADSPIIRAVFFMPDLHINIWRDKRASDHIITKYQSNAYAFFDELNYFLSDHYRTRGRSAGSSFTGIAIDHTASARFGEMTWPIVSFAVCMDTTTEQGATLTEEQLYENTAECLRLWHTGHIEGTMVQGLDNQLLSGYVGRSHEPMIPAFATLGYRALKFPEALMSDYIEIRFLYEYFKHGLLGVDYGAAYGDGDEQRAEFKTTLHECVRRYLFVADREESIPNLEETRRQVLSNYEPSIGTVAKRLFAKEASGIFARVTGGGDEYDPEKIGSHTLLAELEQSVNSTITRARKDMDQEFTSDDVKTSRVSLLKLIQSGAPSAAGGKSGSLENEIERIILRFGIKAATGLTRSVDTCLETLVGDLSLKRRERQERLNHLEAEIGNVVSDCQTARKKDRNDKLNLLIQKLSEKFRLILEEHIDSQITEVINLFCRGENGLLDLTRRNLEGMVTSVTERLGARKDGSSSIQNLEDSYKLDLVKRFAATAEEVATTYLPAVHSFVAKVDAGGTEHENWVTDHLFSKLYGSLVPQDSSISPTRPLRQGADYGRHPDRKGLHYDLSEMLTRPETTGMPTGFTKDGEIAFFRQYFRHDSAADGTAFVQRIESVARSYIEYKTSISDPIRAEINKSLTDRYRALPAEEQQKVREKFSDAGTQTFCQMNVAGGNNPVTHSLYVGSDQTLAEELGYNPKSGKDQFLPSKAANQFIKAKLNTEFCVDRYPHFREYEIAYTTAREDWRRKSGPERPIFSPHIHRLFNEKGVRDAMMELVPPVSLDPALFVWGLLYREMFCAARAASREDLLQEIFYLNVDFVGDRETMISPLLVEEGAGGGTVALGCMKTEMREDRLVLERGAFKLVSGSANPDKDITHKDIFDGIRRNAQIAGVLDEVDKFFRKKCSRSWLDVLETALSELDTKLVPGTKDSTEVREFYAGLRNKFVDLRDELRNFIAAKEHTTAEKPLVDAATSKRRL